MRVLMVEDDVTAARGIALMLKSGGAVVDTADTGEEALELVRHYDYDIVVLDLNAARHGRVRCRSTHARKSNRGARIDPIWTVTTSS